jgi:hypothetical protein
MALYLLVRHICIEYNRILVLGGGSSAGVDGSVDVLRTME